METEKPRIRAKKAVYVKSARINLVVPEQLRDDLEQIAKDSGISLNETVKDILKAAVAANKSRPLTQTGENK